MVEKNEIHFIYIVALTLSGLGFGVETNHYTSVDKKKQNKTMNIQTPQNRVALRADVVSTTLI